MSLSHLKPSQVDIGPDLAAFLSESSRPGPVFDLFAPRYSTKEVCVHLSSIWRQLPFGISLLFINKRQKEALGFQVCQVGMVQGSREITV